MQDTYQMKKKIKILEEELLTEDITMAADQVAATESIPSVIEDKPLLIQKIYHLHQQGYTTDDIAQETDLSSHDIKTILDRKSTRLNSSHVATSYAVFCLKKHTH